MTSRVEPDFAAGDGSQCPILQKCRVVVQCLELFQTMWGFHGGRRANVNPTVLRQGRFRYFFFSREETRMHVHVRSKDGEAKFWLDPNI
jgi:hypothetical protein